MSEDEPVIPEGEERPLYELDPSPENDAAFKKLDEKLGKSTPKKPDEKA